MKKLLIVLLIGLLVVTSVGCNKEMSMNDSKKNPAEQGEQNAGDGTGELPDSYNLLMTLGTETSSTYAMGIQISEHFLDIAPQIRSTVKVGAAGSNIELANAGQTDIAHTQTDLIYAAQNGLDQFTEKKENFKGVATVMESVFHLAVTADSPINTLDEIINQKYPLKISVGAQGSGIESLFRKILGTYNVTYDDIKAWGGRVEFLSMSEAATLFGDGQLNAVTILAGVPYAGITEVATANDIKFIEIPESVKDKLLSQGYMDKPILAGSYKGQDADVSSLGVSISVIASDSANEAVVYEITKFLNSEEGIKILSDVNAGYASYMKGPETGIAGLDDMLHPGAERYYKEVGISK